MPENRRKISKHETQSHPRISFGDVLETVRTKVPTGELVMSRLGEQTICVGVDAVDHGTFAELTTVDGKKYISFSGGGSISNIFKYARPTGLRLTVEEVIQARINFLQRGSGGQTSHELLAFVRSNTEEKAARSIKQQ